MLKPGRILFCEPSRNPFFFAHKFLQLSLIYFERRMVKLGSVENDVEGSANFLNKQTELQPLRSVAGFSRKWLVLFTQKFVIMIVTYTYIHIIRVLYLNSIQTELDGSILRKLIASGNFRYFVPFSRRYCANDDL